MVSNQLKQLGIAATVSLLLSACTPGPHSIVPDHKAENLIGIPLNKHSKLQSATEEDSDKVVIFDKTIKKIHHFNLDTTEHLGSYEVEQPDLDHYVIYGSNKEYFIDLSKKHVSFQALTGRKSATTLKFVGTPISASYDGKQGYLVVYDSYQSVLIFKIDSSGRVIRQFISGPIVDTEGTIQAGDISGNGKLVLSIRGTPAAGTGVSTDFIYIVDIEQTIAESNTTDALIGEKVPTNLLEMSWVAPVTGAPTQILIKSKDALSLMDLVTKTVISSQPITEWVVEKYSKIKDPHVVLRKSYDFYSSVNGNVERRIMYVEGSAIKTKILTKNFNVILNSHLDIKKNQWNVTKVDMVKEYDLYNSFNEVIEGRSFSRVRLSDFLTTIDTKIDDNATVEMSGNFLFSLYSRAMGYATCEDIETAQKKSINNFNVRFMK